MENYKKPSFQTILTGTCALTAIVMHYTFALHHISMPYGMLAFLLSTTLLRENNYLKIRYIPILLVGIVIGMAIKQGSPYFFSTQSLSWTQFGIVMGFSAGSIALANVTQFLMDT